MNAREITLEMIEDSGLTHSAISRALGKERSFLATTVMRGYTPQANNFARIADICGYDVFVRRRSDEYEILVEPYD